jgi:hypothetical protein
MSGIKDTTSRSARSLSTLACCNPTLYATNTRLAAPMQ